MAKGFLTIKDVPQELRTKGAAKLRGQIRDLLANPFIPKDQRAVLESKMNEVAAWEAGAAATAAPVAPEEPQMALRALAPELPPAPVRNALVQLPLRQPQHHTIEVAESLTVNDEPPAAPPETPKPAKRKS